jgi:AcrR family transcriptional regulator
MPPSPEKLKAARERARTAILDAALKVFGARGYADATTAEIAIEAGVSKGLVFVYFPTKDDLLREMIERTLGESLAVLDGAEWEGEAREQLAQVIEDAIAEVLRRPEFHRLYVSLILQPGGSPAVAAAMGAMRPRLQAYYGRIGSLFARLGSPQPSTDAALFQCALNGLSQAIAAQPAGTLPIDSLKARLLDRFSPDERSGQ